MYIRFTKDINKIRNTIFWGLTIREIIVFLLSGLIAFSSFHLAKRFIPTGLALYVIVPVMAIACFFVFYNKNTLKFERLIFNKLKRIFCSSKIRTFQTENIYEILEKKENSENVGDKEFKRSDKKHKTVKKHASQNRSADHTVFGHAKRRNMHGKQ